MIWHPEIEVAYCTTVAQADLQNVRGKEGTLTSIASSKHTHMPVVDEWIKTLLTLEFNLRLQGNSPRQFGPFWWDHRDQSSQGWPVGWFGGGKVPIFTRIVWENFSQTRILTNTPLHTSIEGSLVAKLVGVIPVNRDSVAQRIVWHRVTLEDGIIIHNFFSVHVPFSTRNRALLDLEVAFVVVECKVCPQHHTQRCPTTILIDICFPRNEKLVVR